MRQLLIFLAFVICLPVVAFAQQTSWVQIEAQPSLAEAQERARTYAQDFPNVAGFYVGSGWYAVALGPYTPNDARTLRRQLRRSGAIPADAFVADGARYRSQFWPVGVGVPLAPQPLPGNPTLPTEPQVQQIIEPDETPKQAYRSEAALDATARKKLQTALQWAGAYRGGIDGKFGKGTRNAMARWQTENGYPKTGVLTTQQRAALITAYDAILSGLGLQTVQDDAVGIRMAIPAGVVKFTGYDAPFARFDSTGDSPAQVLLISQEGNGQTLAGLYEIMQTLEIVPPTGPRSLTRRGFTLEGQSNTLHSYTEATLKNGEIKGFTLVWPAGDDERRARVLDEMRSSFTTLDGVLDPMATPPGREQSLDMMSGLEIRRPKISRSGFFITEQGHVATTADVVENCTRLTIDGDHDVAVVMADRAAGLAVLAPQTPLAPAAHAAFQIETPRLHSAVAIAGFPYNGVLSTATMTFGNLADIRGLDGDQGVYRLAASTMASETGGPVFDQTGQVIGMLHINPNASGKRLPDDVSFAHSSSAIVPALRQVVPVTIGSKAGITTEEQITDQAVKMTVLVRCWG